MQGREHLVLVHLHAVAAVELAVHVTVNQLVLVVEQAAALVVLLDAAAAGRVVAGRGQADGAAVGQDKLLLYQSLAKRAATHNQATVVVLQGARKDLAGAGAELVDEHSHLGVLEGAVAVAPHLTVVALVAPLGEDDGLVGGQELIDHEHRHLHEAATVAAQVDHVALGTLLLQAGHGGDEFVIGVAPELVDLDVARVLVDHVVGIDGVDRDVATGDGEGQYLVAVLALDAQLHLAALVAAQALHDHAVGHALARGCRVVDAHDAVSRHDAHFLAGATGYHLNHADGVVDHHKRDADAAERAVQVVG